MMSALHRYVGMVLLVVAAAPTSAMSNELKGSFSGTAYNAIDFPASLNGSVVTGTFDINVGEALVIPNVTSYDYYVVYQDITFDLTLNLPLGGRVVTYDFPNSFGSYGFALGTQQTLQLSAEDNGFTVYDQASLSLTGSNLLDPAEPTILRPGAIDHGVASLYLHGPGVNVSLTSVAFDTVPVPEPPAVLVLLCACAGLAATRIRGTATAGSRG